MWLMSHFRYRTPVKDEKRLTFSFRFLWMSGEGILCFLSLFCVSDQFEHISYHLNLGINSLKHALKQWHLRSVGFFGFCGFFFAYYTKLEMEGAAKDK